MNKFSIGDSVYLGDCYWSSYVVIERNDYCYLDTKISKTGNQSDGFWVSSKDLTFVY